MSTLPDSVTILERLVSFPTISRQPNADLIVYVDTVLRAAGAATRIVVHSGTGNLNLYAIVGPVDQAGVLLSGHTDVVPIAGQDWSSDPFRLTERDRRLYGRGTADMKGFVACAISAALRASSRPLARPLHLALSCDEEIGCVGVRSLLPVLAGIAPKPALCIVGEPTSLRIATGHKGKIAMEAHFHGEAGHSASAPLFANAIHLAADFVTRLRAYQAELAGRGRTDPDYEIPYSTLHAGIIRGGEALNIVPDHCTVAFEARLVAGEDEDALLARIHADAAAVADLERGRFPNARADVEVVNRYPGLNLPPDSDAVRFVTALTGRNSLGKVAFGTEAGLFHGEIGIPALVCGPGSMDQGHKADEFIARDEVAACDAMLDRLIERLCRPAGLSPLQ